MKNKRVFYFAIIISIFFSACSSQVGQQSRNFDLTDQQYVCLEKFFRYFMLHETAIYTLIGSKPMTEISLFYERVPEVEFREGNRDEYLYFLLNKSEKKDMEFYERLSDLEKEEKAVLIHDQDFIYPIEDLWDSWEKLQHQFPIKKQFLLIKRLRPREDWEETFPNCAALYDIFFVDVLKTALVIQENYELFSKAVGYDFDPFEVVFELEEEKSAFWDTLRGREAWRYASLWGLLYGFGKENAFSYTWKGRHIKEPNRTQKEKLWSANFQGWSSCKSRPSLDEKGAFTISNFPIPAFKSFKEEDPVVARYEAERESIKKLYKGKDFVMFTLELLTE